jgi:hypothetical protein
MSDMWLVSGNNYCIAKKNTGISTIKIGEYYCAQMGQIRPFSSANTVVGEWGEGLFKWLYDHGYKHITDEAELARLMLLL